MIMKYDVIVIGAGPGGIFAAYELVEQNKNLSVASICNAFLLPQNGIKFLHIFNNMI